ncbi:hypothetical protein NPIL_62711, partial [Nephila pilipes]
KTNDAIDSLTDDYLRLTTIDEIQPDRRRRAATLGTILKDCHWGGGT